MLRTRAPHPATARSRALTTCPPSAFRRPRRRPDPAGQGLPHTDDELDYGDARGAGLPTEQIPAYRQSGASDMSDQPTQVIGAGSGASLGATAGDPSTDRIGEGDVKIGRGTLDLGLLVLRVAVGGTALVHGLQKLTAGGTVRDSTGSRRCWSTRGSSRPQLLAILRCGR